MSSRISKKSKSGRGRPVDTAKMAQIIAAARTEFFSQGFSQASIESIAARADVSKVTVYNRFGSKEDLFAAAVQSECDTMREKLDFANLSDRGIRDTLINFGLEMTAFLEREEMVRFERHMAVEAENNPIIGQLFLDSGPRRLHGALSALLSKAVDTGKLDISDTVEAAEHLAGMIKGMSDLERRMGQPRSEQVKAKTLKRITSAVDLFLVSYASAKKMG